MKRLFIGGPWDEEIHEVPPYVWHWRVHGGEAPAWWPEERGLYVHTYRLVRMAHSGIERWRGVFVAEHIRDELAERLFSSFLTKKFIEEEPDA